MTNQRIRDLLSPYLTESIDDTIVNQLGSYLQLLLKWNARMNLTAIREPEEIVRRHFGESLFAGQQIAAHLALSPSQLAQTSLLDYGSGAGFPGLPIQILYPDLQVTLAESQSKKSSFLREAMRTLSLKSVVYAGRAETLTAQFDVVALRAVDNMSAALLGSLPLLPPYGTLAVLTSEHEMETVMATAPLQWSRTISMPGSHQGVLMLGSMPA